MSDPSVDARPVEDLDVTFALPEYIRDGEPGLGDLFDRMIEQLQAEAFGIPMHTMQSMLIERIALTYVLIRFREIHGWTGTNAEKDTNARWMDMVKEWNRLLAGGHEQLRAQLLDQMEKIAKEAVNLIPDKETRNLVRNHFQEQFAALGI